MAKGFVVNVNRYDPYKNFKFQIMWDGRIVVGISKCTALKRTTEVVKHREGGDNSTDRKSPGRTTYEAITLERGVTHDPEFEKWANLVHPLDDPSMDLKSFRKDLVLLFNNERGLTVKRYKLYRCWVSEYQAIPDLDANANATAIEMMKLELEGWERDADTPEPDESAAVPVAG
ncbi:phage tail protein [Pelomonas cellulosilytica]|uniref:Phage tail protein n=1 Tax=Pelomonas cellulosilytica TaxID=2906762 RepID=A0ABS8XYE0_9BURK|nr:phage tail protein [Pelomonas sp. P8]MCE4555796.1 phage tail protein [Pelomonas sp. P8]